MRRFAWFTTTLLLIGCGQKSADSIVASRPFVERAQLGKFTEHGVAVKIALETDPDQKPFLRATFTATEAGFHLYSKDLPIGGIDGIGVPTRFTVAPASGILSVGEPFADVQPKQLRVQGMTFPVYPEGPVKIRLPIKIDPSNAEVSAKASFSYMACSEKICLRPVEGKQVAVTIPKLQ